MASSSGKKNNGHIGINPGVAVFLFLGIKRPHLRIAPKMRPVFMNGPPDYLSEDRKEDSSTVDISKYITRFSESNSPVTLYRFFAE